MTFLERYAVFSLRLPRFHSASSSRAFVQRLLRFDSASCSRSELFKFALISFCTDALVVAVAVVAFAAAAVVVVIGLVILVVAN